MTADESAKRPLPGTRPTLTLATIEPGAHYVQVFDDAGSRRVALPALGVAVIGRSEECEVPLADSSASRHHARIDIDGGGHRLVDLDSRNGTRVDGRVIVDAHTLETGDVITVGRSTLVVNLARSAPSIDWLDDRNIRRQLDRELGRASRHRRPLSVVYIDGDSKAARSVLTAKLAAEQTVGVLADGNLLVVLPETRADQADAWAAALTDEIAEPMSAATASYPADGADTAALLTTARSRITGAPDTLVIADDTVIVADPAMERTYQLLRQLSASDLPVLLVGETGTGKELAARALHAWSPRSSSMLVAINCAAVPDALIESELFGHVKGAFSGADRNKMGLIERAAGGTLFLDELAELPAPAQAKLLRALEQRAITPVGAVEPIPVDFRLVAATNRDIAAEIAAGRMREDLYYRVAGALVELPPLRDRPRDIPRLARHFLDRARQRLQRAPMQLSDDAVRALTAYGFPGNVRELANAMDFAAATSSDGVVETWHLPAQLTGPDAGTAAHAAADRRFRPIAEEIAELELRRMREALEAAGGNQSRAAQLIGMPRRTFITKMTRYGLRYPGRPEPS